MKRILYFPAAVLIPAILITICACGGCGFNSGDTPRRIFLVTLDTTRADFINYRLTDNTLTPHFAQLASEGQYFENAYAPTPITLPSHASIFYSMPPHRLKIYNNGQVQKVPRPTVTQLLKGKGFQTGAVISLGVLKSDFGLAKGFQHYVENFKPYMWIKKAGDVNRDMTALIKKMEAAEKEDDTKSFYWLHYSDPHEPYFPPCEDGDFSVSLEGKTLFTCRSTEQAAVNLELQLQPGPNKLVLNTTVPTVLKDYAVVPEYIKYRELTLTPPKGGVTIVPPTNWSKKPGAEGTDYYSDDLRSELTLHNNTPKPVTARLRFHYGMHVNDAARKRFYKEEIKYMDRMFGEFIAFLKKEGLYEGSAFIIIGDHGEGLGEYRDHFGHIHFLNKVYSRVPFLAAGAGIPKVGKREALVSTLNIAPTILDLAGIDKPGFMLGQSILKPFPVKSPKKLLLETYSPEAYFDAFSLIDYPWQIVFYPGRKTNKLEFFNLKNDLSGTLDLNNINNVTDEARSDSVRKRKTGLINEVLKISRIITATKGKFGKSIERHREILKSLGYL